MSSGSKKEDELPWYKRLRAALKDAWGRFRSNLPSNWGRKEAMGSPSIPGSKAPTIASWECSEEWGFPEDFSIGNWPGLLLCQTLYSASDDGAKSRLLVTWWKRPSDFEEFKEAFQKDLRLDASSLVARRETKRICNEEKKAPGVSPKAFVLGLAATVTALVTLFSVWGDFTEKPDFSVSFQDPSPKVTMLSKSYDFVVINHSPTRPLVVEARVEAFKDGGLPVEIQCQLPKTLIVPKAGKGEIKLDIVTAEPLSRWSKGEIEATVFGKVGKLRGAMPMSSILELETWPNIEKSPPLKYYNRVSDAKLAGYFVIHNGGKTACQVQMQISSLVELTVLEHGKNEKRKDIENYGPDKSGLQNLWIWQLKDLQEEIPHKVEFALFAKEQEISERVWEEIKDSAEIAITPSYQ